MISVARALLDKGLDSPENPTLEQAKAALRPLAKVAWKLHDVPWRGLLLVYSPNSGKWSMRNESRKPATDTAKKVLRWITGHYQADDREEAKLRDEWQDQLILPHGENVAGLWEKVRKLRDHVST